MKILVAEDTKAGMAFMSAHIKDMGHEVIEAVNGQEAIDLFYSDRPDLILMDVHMPIKDGLDATREIKAECAKRDDWIPIVFLSGLSEAGDVVEGIEAGGDDYLSKPVDPVVLKAKLMAMERIWEMKRQLNEALRELELISILDPLTQIYNRRFFNDQMRKEYKSAVRDQAPLSVLLLDIDHFKLFNDNYGHQEGDRCLKEVSQILKTTLSRPLDVVSRYGGEEFVVVLPGTPHSGAQIIAGRLIEAVMLKNIEHAHSTTSKVVTISCGVATSIPQRGKSIAEGIKDIVEKADRNLYRAKQAGRNQSCG